MKQRKPSSLRPESSLPDRERLWLIFALALFIVNTATGSVAKTLHFVVSLLPR
ncbi:hypothetical protein [Reticulibacter mediterranei]|uniref:hypothetical protein n=1 Tax=Reticulibacter mediterranei TaxID=2778369 RepID=UPI001C68D94F|nr:hypothetical protein [Reticulibacter mediterranei]